MMSCAECRRRLIAAQRVNRDNSLFGAKTTLSIYLPPHVCDAALLCASPLPERIFLAYPVNAHDRYM